MIFWVFAIAITAATCYAIARPFLNKPPEDDPLNTAAYDVAVFKSQLREVERDLARNRITPEEAEASRVEIGRRLLIADKRQSELEKEKKRSGTSRTAHAIGGTVIIAAVFASVLLYGRMGDPRNPDMPLALRQAELQLAQGGNQTQPNAGTTEAGTLDAAASQLRGRLQAGQGGSEDWALLGRTEMMRGDFEAAASAYMEALKDNPDDPTLNSAYGEALVFWADGDVTDTAATVFQKVLNKQPDDVRARFYLADYARQEGRYKEALDGWLNLLKSASADAPWIPSVRERAQALADEMGVDISRQFAQLPAASPPALGTLEDAKRQSAGPSADDIAAAEQMAPDQRQDMIQGMVEGLAARLAEDPSDFAGWMRLIRSQVVLGDKEAAQASLETARAQFASAPVPTQQLNALAAELGLEEASTDRPGPTQEDIAAAQDMTPEDQMAMIEGMVGTLAARLEQNPNDLQGWVMLGRSYRVLNRPEEAIAALEKAAALAPENVDYLIERARLMRSVAGDQQTPETVALMRDVLALDADNIEALWFLGLDAYQRDQRDAARDYFDKALANLVPGSEEYRALQAEITRMYPAGN
ncbi:MAG: c-type cytochrome biogenesis protein CcmI [Rhodospirillales bacterium]|jgi:cytochrome c-type biogenesis protein CcmH|uniref:c-type cytochrome biogenesis protein CcmI n=1 Tax=Hwanghaeella sp. 1Z406 TaxID=3402811 RepID=UPI000C938F52|nr:c-type cytochrome biogenesis protein CcmI [Rhodospirillales bacterium]|tara:strand:+ start:68573 stop:70336 length:1764 start_codon:yes stop_codon:yes gene_type:complete